MRNFWGLLFAAAGFWTGLVMIGEGAQGAVEMGVHGALNFAAVGNQPPSARPDSAQTAAAFGVAARYRLNELFSVETGLGWAGRSQGKRITVNQTPYQCGLSSKELRVPVLARLGGVVGFSLAGGMYFSELIGDVSWSVNPAPSAEHLAAEDELRPEGTTLSPSDLGWERSDYGLEFRLGYQFPAGAGVFLFVEGDYRVGLKNLAAGTDTSGSIKKMAAYGASAGLTIPL